MLLAQKEGNIWYFGNMAGLDFNSGSPVALTNGMVSTTEGSSSICDFNGNLLFYSDGVSVWNKNHQKMPNGNWLHGHTSSTQSAVIVKKPGLTTKYYVFTIAPWGWPDGLSYSVVDMNLNGGLGDVNSNKNILVVAPTCEKIAVVKHHNNIDFWVVVHLYGSNIYHSYLLTASGLNTTPIVSSIGLSISGNISYTIGYLKSNIDGNRIVSANSYQKNVEIFDFDNSTGQLSNLISLNVLSGWGPYGVEFSPNGDLLYISIDTLYPYIYQYNLIAGSTSNINNSRVKLQGVSRFEGGALQLGPDNKIYFARNGDYYLGTIANPDVIGIGCNYIDQGVSIAPKHSTIGLPCFYSSIYSNMGFNFINTCNRDTTLFYTDSVSVNSVLWDFGDINSGANNQSILFYPQHIFSDTGSFIVTLIKSYSNKTDTMVMTIYISGYPQVNLGHDTIVCKNDVLALSASTPHASYLWQDNSNNPVYYASMPGVYWVDIFVNQCRTRDTIVVSHFSFPNVDLSNDTIMCIGDSIELNASNPKATYLWQDNSKDSLFMVHSPGIYWVRVTDSLCTDIDSIYIGQALSPDFSLGNDTSICDGDNFQLKVPLADLSYLWQDLSTNQGYTVSLPGTYWVTVTNSCGAKYDTIIIDFEDCDIDLIMPNVFTPNNDGYNDLFIPIKISNIKKAEIIIINRWGQQIYENADLTSGWNGTFKENECAEGVYYWLVIYYDEYSNVYRKQGTVTLFR